MGLPLPDDCRRSSPIVRGRSGVSSRYSTNAKEEEVASRVVEECFLAFAGIQRIANRQDVLDTQSPVDTDVSQREVVTVGLPLWRLSGFSDADGLNRNTSWPTQSPVTRCDLGEFSSLMSKTTAESGQ